MRIGRLEGTRGGGYARIKRSSLVSTDETVGAMCGKPSVQCRRQGHPHIFVRWRAAIRLVPLSDPPYSGTRLAPMADKREVCSK